VLEGRALIVELSARCAWVATVTVASRESADLDLKVDEMGILQAEGGKKRRRREAGVMTELYS
jgi:hypothetical protein